MVNFIDAMDVSGVRRRESDGALLADARVARTGIQYYYGREVERDDEPGRVFRVYRSADQVFDKAAMASFAHRPVTNDHPPGAVAAENWHEYAAGTTGGDVARDGEYLRVPLMVSDGRAISDVEAGKVQLSAGYTCTLDWTPGETPDGEAYDAAQIGITANHVAIVHRGRAGKEARIGDDATPWGATPVTTTDRKDVAMADAITLRTVQIDGLPVETTDAGAQALEKLMKALDAKDEAARNMADDYAATIAEKDEEIGGLKADLKKARDNAITPEKLDAAVADRVALVTAAKAIDKDLDPTGMTDAEIRRAAVAKRFGDEMVSDASDAEIAGMFKAAQKDAKADPVRSAITALPDAVGDAQAAKARAFEALKHYDQHGQEMEAN